MHDVLLGYHLPLAFSQPLGSHYHQTTGFMGESRQRGKASEMLLLKEHEEQGVLTGEGYGWLSIAQHSCHERGREWSASESKRTARK